MNDLRAIAGFEWGFSDQIRAGRRTAFADVGYVLDREIVYRNNPQDNLDLDDGVMFRLGIGYQLLFQVPIVPRLRLIASFPGSA